MADEREPVVPVQFPGDMGFVQTESSMEGFEVYVPEDEAEQDPAEAVAFACPNCLAKTAYSAADRGLTCTNCGYFEPLDTTSKDASQLDKFPFDLDLYQQAAHGWGGVRDEVECQNCYARISLDEGQLTTKCPFCASQKVVHHKAEHDALRPLSVIPFIKTVEDVKPGVSQWLGNSWMLPNDLRTAAVLKNFTGIYLPFWIVDMDVSGKWKAEFGTRRNDRTVWKWRSGKFNEAVRNFIVTGTKHVTPGLLESISNYDLKVLQGYDPSYLVGWQAQAYEHTLEQAWRDAREEVRFGLQDDIRRQAKRSNSGMMRKFSFNMNYADEGWRYVLLPVYLSAFTFREKTYQVVVNGQTGSISGSRPVNWPIVYAAMFAIFIPGILFACAFSSLFFAVEDMDAQACVVPLAALALCAFLAMRTHRIARRIANPDDRQKTEFEQYMEGMVPWEMGN